MKPKPLKGKRQYNELIKCAWYYEPELISAVEWLKEQFNTKETMFDYPFIIGKIRKAFPDLQQKRIRSKE